MEKAYMVVEYANGEIVTCSGMGRMFKYGMLKSTTVKSWKWVQDSPNTEYHDCEWTWYKSIG